MKPEKVTITATVNAPVEKVWKFWNEPGHITKWNNASEDWHSPSANIDLQPGGKFNIRMEAKDGSMGFDFGGEYTEVKQNQFISYTMGDGRKVQIEFTSSGNKTEVVEHFEPESQNPVEFQKGGWQAILNNFKNYAETNS